MSEGQAVWNGSSATTGGFVDVTVGSRTLYSDCTWRESQRRAEEADAYALHQARLLAAEQERQRLAAEALWYRAAVAAVAAKQTPREDGDPMETLYRVVVVSKDRKVILDKTVVAPDESGADFEADVSGALRTAGLKPQQVTVIRQALGQVKVEREPEKVRLVKDDEPAATAAGS